jgi:hypothetical protein
MVSAPLSAMSSRRALKPKDRRAWLSLWRSLNTGVPGFTDSLLYGVERSVLLQGITVDGDRGFMFDIVCISFGMRKFSEKYTQFFTTRHNSEICANRACWTNKKLGKLEKLGKLCKLGKQQGKLRKFGKLGKLGELVKLSKLGKLSTLSRLCKLGNRTNSSGQSG